MLSRCAIQCMPSSLNVHWNDDHMPLSEGVLSQDLCTRRAQCLAMPALAQSRSLAIAAAWK